MKTRILIAVAALSLASGGAMAETKYDLLLQGGNLEGALGTFGCAVLPLPVALIITE